MFYRLEKHLRHDYDQNIVELFKPIYTLLSITGLFPYSIIFPKGKYDCKITRRYWVPHFLCGIIVFAYVGANCVFCFMSVSFTPNSILTEINYIIEILIVLICTISSYFFAYRYRIVHVRVLRRIAFVWTDLSNAPNHDVKPILIYLRELFKVPFIFWLLFAVPVETLLSMIGHLSFWEYWFLVLPEAVPSLVVIFFSATVLMVVGLLKNIKHHCLSLEAKKYQNNSVHVTKTSQNLKEDYWILLKNLELAYVNALEVKQEINILFRAPLLIITMQCFHAIICEVHTLYHELIIERHFEIFSIIDRSYAALYSFGKMLVLTSTGTFLKNEVSQLAQVLHRIPIQTQNQNLCLLMQIQHFSNLISFHGADISIYGFFTLDATLLFGMIASMATYLIILVQFDDN